MNKSEGLSGRIFGITVCAAVLLSAHIGCFTADAAEKTETIAGSVYEFDEKNEYTVDSAEPSGARSAAFQKINKKQRPADCFRGSQCETWGTGYDYQGFRILLLDKYKAFFGWFIILLLPRRPFRF